MFALEYDNLRTALAWSLGHDPVRGLRLVQNLGVFWMCWGLDPEGQRWRDAFLARSTVESSERAWVLFHASVADRDLGDYPTACAKICEALATARQVGDEVALGCALRFSGVVASDRGEYVEGNALLNESLQFSHVIENRALAADTRVALAHLALREGDYPSARAIAEEYVADVWVHADAGYAAFGPQLRGAVALATGDLTRARALLENSVTCYRDVVDRPSQGLALTYLGYVEGSAENYPRAVALQRKALELFQKLGHRPRAALTLFFMGLVAIRAGEFERGVALVAAAEATPGFFLTCLAPSQCADRDSRLVDARQALGETTFDAVWAIGDSLAFDQAVSLGLASGFASDRTLVNSQPVA